MLYMPALSVSLGEGKPGVPSTQRRCDAPSCPFGPVDLGARDLRAAYHRTLMLLEVGRMEIQASE